MIPPLDELFVEFRGPTSKLITAEDCNIQFASILKTRALSQQAVSRNGNKSLWFLPKYLKVSEGEENLRLVSNLAQVQSLSSTSDITQ